MRMMGVRAANRMAVVANDTIATAASVAFVVARLVWSEVDMKFAIAICAVMPATAFATDTLRAQGTVQSITASRVDVVQLASGYRASKVIGSTVYNDGRDTIGKIEIIQGSALCMLRQTDRGRQLSAALLKYQLAVC